MNFFIDGIWLGLALSILTGPILFALIQTSLEHGFRRGVMVAMGVWISDLIFVLVTYFGITYVNQVTNWSGFELTLGLFGGIVLMAFGLGMLLSKAPQIPLLNTNTTEEEVLSKRVVGVTDIPTYSALFLKGFLINTLNPFSVFFWTGVASTVIAGNNLNASASMIFYSGVLGIIVLTDALKCWLAKVIRKWLRPVYILWLRRVSGAILIGFGIVLILRVAIF